MKKPVIFFHGGAGDEDFAADEKLVESLKLKLGPDYSIHYPFLSNDQTPDFGRRRQIAHELSLRGENVILVGHSLGASMLLVHLSENKVRKKIAAVFLVATPFWSGDEDWVRPLKLPHDFAELLPKDIPLFFYHAHDDEEVPFTQLSIYKQKLPWATFREIPTGGHQLNNDLTIVANDIIRTA